MAPQPSDQNLQAASDDPPIVRVEIGNTLASRDADFHRLIDAFPQQTVLTDPSGKHLYANRTALEYHGVNLDTFLSESFQSRVCHPDDLARLREFQGSSLSPAVPLETEVRLRGKDGRYRWFLLHSNPMRDEQGRVIRWFGTRIDVDDRKRAEERVRLVIDTTPAMVHTGRPDGYLDYFNRGWLDFLGVSLDAVEGWNWTSLVHPDDIGGLLSAWRASLASGEPLEYETRTRRADGEYRWCLHRKLPLRDELGNIVKWYGSSIDIDDRKRSEDALRRSEFYSAEGHRLAHSGSWAFNSAGFEYWSPQLFEIHGLDPHGKPPSIPEYLALVHPEDRDFVAQTIQKMLSEYHEFDFTKRIVRPDGVIRHLRCVGIPSQSGQGFVGTGMDVTDQEQLTAALRNSESQWRAVFANSSVGIVLIDENIRFVSANPAYQKMVGYTESELQTMHPREYTYPEDVQASEAIYTDIRQNRRDSAYYEKRYRRRDGKVVWVECYATRLPSGGESGSLFAAVIVDITERKAAEEALRRRQAYLATAQTLNHTGSFAINLTTGEIIWSEEMFRIYGYEPFSFKPTIEWIMQRMHPEDLEFTNEALDRITRERIAPDLEYRIILPNGSVKHLHVVMQILDDSPSKNLECVGSLMDVTEHHLARKAMEDAYDEIKKLKDELYRENVALKEEIDQASMFEEIVGSSKSLKKVLEDVVKVAPTDSTVLITGEPELERNWLPGPFINGPEERVVRSFVSIARRSRRR